MADKLDEADVEADSDKNDDTEVNYHEENKEDTAVGHQVITSVQSRINKETWNSRVPVSQATLCNSLWLLERECQDLRQGDQQRA